VADDRKSKKVIKNVSLHPQERIVSAMAEYVETSLVKIHFMVLDERKMN